MRFAVVAPVAAGVTADPGWRADFARHLRYADDYQRTDAGWRIAHCALTVDAIETRPVRRLRG